MKSVYFVRHGESEGNTRNAFQGPNEPLSEKGVEQARILAERFLHIPVDVVLASTDKRAHHTAEIVNEKIKKPIEFLDDLAEMRRPNELWGKSSQDEKAQEILELLREHAHDPDWRYSNEENFIDRKTRAARVVDVFLERKEEAVLAVSHGTAIRTFLVYMLLGDDLTSHDYYKFLRFFHLSNTGISLCKYFEDESRWQLVHWNDIAHLG